MTASGRRAVGRDARRSFGKDEEGDATEGLRLGGVVVSLLLEFVLTILE